MTYEMCAKCKHSFEKNTMQVMKYSGTVYSYCSDCWDNTKGQYGGYVMENDS